MTKPGPVTGTTRLAGVIGDPTGANEAAGAELFKIAVEQLAEALAEVKRFRFR